MGVPGDKTGVGVFGYVPLQTPSKITSPAEKIFLQ